jgi:acetyltransferase
MSVRNLEILFNPASIALIGASRQPRSVGSVVAKNLFNAGFDGPIMPVNPHERAIEGVLAYPSVAALPLVPDLAVIATPAATVPGIVAELAARGTRATVVISAGFGELGEAGRTRQQAMLDAARPAMLRIVGPNCLGLLVPGRGINASFAPRQALPGDLAFIAQSGAVLTAVLDWASERRIGFSHLVSVGGMADVDVGDLLDYLATDSSTRAILLYVEAITQARKFMSAARAAARAKPVVVIKAGRSEAAAKAARSHTGALAGADAVYEAAFRRAGMLRVDDLDELFAAVATLATGLDATGDRLAIVSNGGGVGVLATDSLIAEGGRLAELGADTLTRLDQALPPVWSHANPVDLIGDATGERYAAALEALLADPGNDAILVMNCPTAVADSTEAAEATVGAAAGQRRPVLTCWLGDGAAAEARRLFAAHRMPSYETPSAAIRAFMHLVRYRRNQASLREVPPSVPEHLAPDRAAAEAIIDAALAEGRAWLSEAEAKRVLGMWDIPVVPTEVAATPAEATAIAARLGQPVALKILSPDITHKSDVGGVMLGLADPMAVLEAARTMLANLRAHQPEARLEGFTVQPMVDLRHGFELLVGLADDPTFGPVILFGQGGTAVEVIRDRALALPPLNPALARALIDSTRIAALLKGYRDRPPADLDALALTLVKVAQLAADLDRVAELDINPLLAGRDGVLALDARIRVAAPAQRGTARFAIRPYPQELEQAVTLADGRRLEVRPIRPEDAAALRHLVERKTAPADRRLRFFAAIRVLSPELCARLTQIDYDREMALVALDPALPAEEGFCGVVRIAADPDRRRAEYAILVQSDLKGHGLGTALMRIILDYARSQGIGEVFGMVLRENRAMLELAEHLGFRAVVHPEDPELVEVRLALAGQPGQR